MRIGIIFGSALLCGMGLFAQAQQPGVKQPGKTPAVANHKHAHLHHALHALHHAHEELKESKEDFGGHKEKAMHDIDKAIKQIHVILKHEKDTPTATPSKGEYAAAHKKYKHHPSLHHALHEVKLAHHQLKESKDDFGGHREKALHDMDRAIHQIELVLKNAKAAGNNKKGTASK